MATTTQSRKNRGRKFQQQIRQKILDAFDLKEDDVASRSMGSSGEDLMLSPKARKCVPFSIEAKNQEKVSLWSWWEQCKANAEHTPLLIFKRNRSEDLVVLRFDDLLELLKGK